MLHSVIGRSRAEGLRYPSDLDIRFTLDIDPKEGISFLAETKDEVFEIIELIKEDDTVRNFFDACLEKGTIFKCDMYFDRIFSKILEVTKCSKPLLSAEYEVLNTNFVLFCKVVSRRLCLSHEHSELMNGSVVLTFSNSKGIYFASDLEAITKPFKDDPVKTKAITTGPYSAIVERLIDEQCTQGYFDYPSLITTTILNLVIVDLEYTIPYMVDKILERGKYDQICI